MKNVLIIGGNGFIGTNLAKYLSTLYNVFSFDIQNPKQKEKNVTYIEGDFFDDEVLNRALENIDVVIHSLSTVNPGNSNTRFMQGYSRDFVQSAHLFDLCVQKNIKVIFLSSGGTVYGIQDVQPIKEDALANPINHYGSVKLCIETVLKTFNKQSHSKMIIARISNPYGPGQDFNKGVGFIDAALKKALNNETIEIWGDGTVVRDYIYIEDVCKMIATLIEYDGEEEVFNISSNEGVSLNDVIKEIRELGLNPNVVYKDARSVDVPKVVLDNSKIESIHSFEIQSFKEGLCKYYQYLIG
ncbi:NAD-dependent epimerase/dehydratase family protein [Floccifex sp.]|uniref:NAD-dependent epimerase/dehydratase family protein n=1 Tax=Floccifex sp. TaxID=2815810 RepID=UPI002A74DFC2|nr:NAD-dependent epimerase/dehydratase family protein [Floccifex sp.]MDD7280465.1 NAD-dependent epimerase/dehydratase family protein [Erysipelotrichaceae bacterium]MDY2957856.1 NAD-dependent epimerase/dehydratase family protein [Floccifex sp.]